ESPRWLFLRGKRDTAYAALLRSRTEPQADVEIAEMEQVTAAEKAKSSTGAKVKESLLRRKYVIPFVLACVILACNQATGINSIIGYNTNILMQSGLSDLQAHWGYVIFTIINFLTTIGSVLMVDRWGRPGLLFRSFAPACSFDGRKACGWIREAWFSPWSRPIRRSRLPMTRNWLRRC